MEFPQGSVLGPLLFLLYINDLPNISNKLRFFLFADDTNIYYESKDLHDIEYTVNKELQKLHEWLSVNRLSLNISKTNFVIFHSNRIPINSNVTIMINKTAIEEVSSIKYLGFLIDSQLTFKDHIMALNKKLARSIGVLYKLRPYVSSKILVNVYYAIMYPFLLYGITAWGNATNNLIEPIHLLQKVVVRMITFNDNYLDLQYGYTHSSPLFHELKILKIYDIYKVQVGKFVYESINAIGPSQSIINYTMASEIHHHNTRFANHGGIYVNRFRTSRYGLRSLKNDGREIWNTIPPSIQSKPTKNSFRSSYKKLLVNQYI